jgi:hypothetical protein
MARYLISRPVGLCGVGPKTRAGTFDAAPEVVPYEFAETDMAGGLAISEAARGIHTSRPAVGAVVDNVLYAQRHMPVWESGQSTLIVKLRAMSCAPWKNASFGPRRGTEAMFAS